jgi:hypothetical protein
VIIKIESWLQTNESGRPRLVAAAKDIITALVSKRPNYANWRGLPRCVEICPAYLSKNKDYSPQTSRNAWSELKDIVGWNELPRKQVRRTITKLGFQPRKPKYGHRYGTHLFISGSVWRELKKLCFRLGLLKSKRAKPIVTSIINNTNNTTTKKELSPLTPQGEKRQSRRGRVDHPKYNQDWKSLSYRLKVRRLLFYTMEKESLKSSRNIDKGNGVSLREDNWGPLAAFRVCHKLVTG